MSSLIILQALLGDGATTFTLNDISSTALTGEWEVPIFVDFDYFNQGNFTEERAQYSLPLH